MLRRIRGGLKASCSWLKLGFEGGPDMGYFFPVRQGDLYVGLITDSRGVGVSCCDCGVARLLT